MKTTKLIQLMILTGCIVGIAGCGGSARFEAGPLALTLSGEGTPSAHASDPVCPSGMSLVSPSNQTSFCMDNTPSGTAGTADHSTAMMGCLGRGVHVCRAQQLIAACAANRVDGHAGADYWAEELTFKTTSPNVYGIAMQTTVASGGNCSGLSWNYPANTASSKNAFYCCTE